MIEGWSRDGKKEEGRRKNEKRKTKNEERKSFPLPFSFFFFLFSLFSLLSSLFSLSQHPQHARNLRHVFKAANLLQRFAEVALAHVVGDDDDFCQVVLEADLHN